MCNNDTKYTNISRIKCTFALIQRNSNIILLDTILISNMINAILEKKTQRKQYITSKTTLSEKSKSTFTPSRFSVRRLRKHTGIQIGRNPAVMG